jgi:glycosyltransferase involved in cell wall biosynthesis
VSFSHPGAPLDVCIVSNWFYPQLIGPGERFRRYAPGLRERGIQLRVITTCAKQLPDVETIDGISIRRFWVEKGGAERSSVLLKKALMFFQEEKHWPDVLQIMNLSHRNIPYVLKARWNSIPTVFIFTMMPGERATRRNPLHSLVNRLSFNCFDKVVTSSDIMTKELINLHLPGKKIETIFNGVDLGRFRPTASNDERNRIREKLNLDAKQKIILFVGNISYRKGIDVLAQAWHTIAKQDADAHLILVGDYRVSVNDEKQKEVNEFCDKIDRLIDSSPAPERVTFTGKVQNVEDYFRAADVFVFPSRREGMPNVIPEAMACGLPCIVTPFEGLPDIFGIPDRDYRLAERNPEAIADSVIELLKDEEKSRYYRINAYNWVKANLDFNESLDRFAKLYRDLAGS